MSSSLLLGLVLCDVRIFIANIVVAALLRQLMLCFSPSFDK